MSVSGGFKINVAEFEKLQDVMKGYQGDVETTINDVLHNEAASLIQDSIRRLIPVSGKKWKGKAPAAKTGNSLRNVTGNVSITVTTTKKYQYLYFPDDGTSTTRHAGDQQFFAKGGDAVTDEIIERCISKLTNNFE